MSLVAAGCTGGSENAAAGGECQTPGFSADQVKLGIVYPDSGTLGPILGPARSGMAARIQEANDAGGIHGRRIVYEWRDDAGDRGRNLQAVRDLVENENVFGLLEASTAASGGADYLAQNQVPVAGLPAESAWTKYANMFAYSYLFTEGSSVDTFGQYVVAQGGRKAAFLNSDLQQAITTDIGHKIEASLAAAGVEIVPEKFVYNQTVPDVRRLATRIKDSGADVVVATLSAASVAEVMEGLRAVQANIKVVLSPNGYDRSLLGQVGPKLAGLSVFLNYVPFEANTEAHRRYLDSMARYAPELVAADQEIAFVAYIATDLFLHGLEVAGPCPTRQDFIQSLRAVTDYNADGLLPGPVNLTESFGQISTCYTFIKINAAGDGFEIVPSPNAPDGQGTQWCGRRI